MIVVNNNSEATDNCNGLQLISANVTLDAVTDYCGDGTPSTVQVWVSTSTPTIAQSFAAGNPIYLAADCTQCPSPGYYRDLLSSYASSYYYWKGCEWVNIGNCTWRRKVTIRTHTKSSVLCEGVGALVETYLSNDYDEGDGIFVGTGNNIYTTTGLYMNATGTQTSDLSAGYYRTTDLALEWTLGEATWIRFWGNPFNAEGGSFAPPAICGGIDPPPPTYDSFSARFEPGVFATEVCDNTINTYYMLSGEVFEEGTILYHNETGSVASNGYYVSAEMNSIREEGGRPIYRIMNGNGQLTSTVHECTSFSDPR